jgi:hypothetical protein
MNDNGGPAFPQVYDEWDHDNARIRIRSTEGMSLRDHFAIHALGGLLASDAHPEIALFRLMDSEEKIAARAAFAYKLADAMLKVRAE